MGTFSISSQDRRQPSVQQSDDNKPATQAQTQKPETFDDELRARRQARFQARRDTSSFESAKPRPPVALQASYFPPSDTSVTLTGDKDATVPISEGVKAGVNVESSVTYKTGAPTPDEKLQNTVTFEVSGKTSFSASVEGEVKALELEGQALTGVQTSYEVKVPADKAEDIKSGKSALPNPYDPSTLPVGSSVLVKGENFTGTALEASFRGLAVETSQTNSAGVAYGVEKTGPNTVKITAGPTEAVSQEVFAGVKLGPVKVGVGAENSLREYQLKSVEIDLSTDASKAAYQKFLLTGEVPKSDPSQGVTKSSTIQQLTQEHVASAELELGPLDLKAKLNNSSSEVTTAPRRSSRRPSSSTSRRCSRPPTARTARRTSASAA
jgi:hypothetical protein